MTKQQRIVDSSGWYFATVICVVAILLGAVLLSPGQYWKPVKQYDYGENPFHAEVVLTTAADVKLIRDGDGLLLQWRQAGTLWWWNDYKYIVRCQWLARQWPENWPPETLVGINFNENWKVTKVTTPVGVVCQ